LQHESVAKAADDLCLTQSTVSGALARLRDIYDDPLLIRVGRSSQLSPVAVKLKQKVEQVCIELEGVFQSEEFDPKTAEYHFWVAAPDYLVFLVSRVLIEQLHKEAPNVRIHFVNVPNDLPDKLDDRSIDLAICADFGIWHNLEKTTVSTEQTLLVVSETHPLLDKKSVSLEDLKQYPGIYYDASAKSGANKLYDPASTANPLFDYDPYMQISSGQIFDQLFIAAETNTVVRSPECIYRYLKRTLPIRSIVIDEGPVNYDTAIFWSNEQGGSDAGSWLRETLINIFKESEYF
jgi:DNA-binding transcriptional LysR family regulator